MTVSAMIDCGASAQEIADSTALDVADLEHHLDVCCRPPATLTSVEEALAASDQRLQVLSERISATIVSAGLTGDCKSQLGALSLAVRVELENRRRAEEAAKAAVHDLPLDPNSWTDLEKSKFHAWLDSIIPSAAYLVNLTPAQIAAEFRPLCDPDGITEKELAEALRNQANIIIDHRSEIPALDETMRIFRFRVAEIEKKQAQLVQTRGVTTQ
jgi:hypothetical protein